MALETFDRLKDKFTKKVDPTTQNEVNSATAAFYNSIKGEDGYVDLEKLDDSDNRANAYTAFTSSINTAMAGRGLQSTANDADMKAFQTDQLWYADYGFTPTELKVQVDGTASALSQDAFTQIFNEKIQDARKRKALTPYQALDIEDKVALLTKVGVPDNANTDRVANIADLIKIEQTYTTQPYNQFSRMMNNDYGIDLTRANRN